MAIINSSDSKFHTYDPGTHISELEVELASILFICGLDGSDPYAYTIDQMVESVKDTFKVNRTGPWIGSVPPEEGAIIGGTEVSAGVNRHTAWDGRQPPPGSADAPIYSSVSLGGTSVHSNTFLSSALSTLDTTGAGMPVESMLKKWSRSCLMTCRRSHRWLRIASYAKDNND